MVERELPDLSEAVEADMATAGDEYDLVDVNVNVAGHDRVFNILRRNRIYIPYISFLSEILLDLREESDLHLGLSDLSLDLSSDLNKLFLRWDHYSESMFDYFLKLLEPEEVILDRLVSFLAYESVPAEYEGRIMSGYKETYLGFFQQDGVVSVNVRGNGMHSADDTLRDPSYLIDDMKKSLQHPRRHEFSGPLTTFIGNCTVGKTPLKPGKLEIHSSAPRKLPI